jgi:hypothetical protein
MTTNIRHDQDVLLHSLLSGKLPRNLSWSDVVALIGHIGQVEARGSDEFTFVVGGGRAIFKRPSTHHLEVEEVSRLRTFLKSAEEQGALGEPGPQPDLSRVVVVIDHHAAHLYQSRGQAGAAAIKGEETEITVAPYDPFGFHHHLIHRKEAHYQGERVPEENEYYEQIAKDIASADEITLVGHGTGKSSAVDYLSEYLKTHHPDTWKKVIDTERVDISALTEPEIEQIAQKHLLNRQ